MRYTQLGNSGLEISKLCLGCLSFGDPNRGDHSWTLDEERSRPIVRAAIEAGINFFDTANVYSDGSSEQILGRLLKEFASRDDVVIATKVGIQMRPGPHGGGLSRKAILSAVDASLKRLGTDYIDLYQIHRLDPAVPIEETLEALHDTVKAGKVRYLGASSMYAWEFARLLHKAERAGSTRFVSMQNQVNLIYREEEREMLPLCAAEGVGVIAWSPVARGRLTRPWAVQTNRSSNDALGRKLYDHSVDADRPVIDEVSAIAGERHVTMAQVALAWLLENAQISAPLLGVTKLEQLEEAITAIDLRLGDGDGARLERHYAPHRVVGF
jgi:aryl-alcohol dehydrogenase-like predicted oxidoreductase